MTWLSLTPALAIVASLLVLTAGLRRVEIETVALRSSLRRSQAAAVALDDFGRTAERVAERADDLRSRAHHRVGLRPRWWTLHRAIGR